MHPNSEFGSMLVNNIQEMQPSTQQHHPLIISRKNSWCGVMFDRCKDETKLFTTQYSTVMVHCLPIVRAPESLAKCPEINLVHHAGDER